MQPPKSPIQRLVLRLIRLYQRQISPLKGYRCAYRIHTGRASCSELGYRAIRRLGLWQGLRALRQRMLLCGVAHRRYSLPDPRPPLQQRGDCDPGCDAPFDCEPGGHSGFSVFDCCDGGCDAGGCDGSDKKDKRKKSKEKSIYLPPKRKIR